jgi:hypothetical protein
MLELECKIKRRQYYLISVILVVVVVVGLVYLDYAGTFQPKSTPPNLYTSTTSDQDSGVTAYVMNVSQGAILRVNLTLSSLSSTEIAVPIESLTLTAYNSNSDTGNASLAQQSVFNYSFSVNQLTLQPQMSNSTTVTINMAKDAPTGTCTLEINLGALKFLSEPGKYDRSYSSSIPLEMVITPKPT